MRAAQRLAFYASRFPLVLVDSTYRFPPTPDVARQWVERTPDGFTMDVVAWSLLTHNATLPDSLWPDLQEEVRPEARDRRRLYHDHLTAEARTEAWRRFRHALEPLQAAGRLGCVVLRYPYWMRPGGRRARPSSRPATPWATCAWPWSCPTRRGSTTTGASPLSPSWRTTTSPSCAPTGPAGRGPASGGGQHQRPRRGSHGGPQPGRLGEPDMEMAQRFAYRYRLSELEEWVPRIAALATSAAEVHVLLANCWRDDAVTNAAELAALLRASHQDR